MLSPESGRMERAQRGRESMGSENNESIIHGWRCITTNQQLLLLQKKMKKLAAYQLGITGANERIQSTSIADSFPGS